MEFPVAFKAEKVGKYVLDVTASKTGHKNETRSMRFFVINEPAKPVNAVICKADGICSGRENHSNCPQNCPPDEKDGVCMSKSDGVCDPDCYEGVDPDCAKKPDAGLVQYLPYAALPMILVIAYAAHRRREEKKIEKQRREFEQWKAEREAASPPRRTP